MTLQKAIENLKDTYDFLQSVLSTEDLEAIKLGIEALEAIIEWRIDYNDDNLIELPGDTKEYIPPNIGTLPSDQDYDNEVSK